MTNVEETIEQIFIDFVKDFITKDKQDRILQFYKNSENSNENKAST